MGEEEDQRRERRGQKQAGQRVDRHVDHHALGGSTGHFALALRTLLTRHGSRLPTGGILRLRGCFWVQYLFLIVILAALAYTTFRLVRAMANRPKTRTI